jgi:exodeoxyribonuclease VII small subunit
MKKITFEKALESLEKIVEELEKGELSLDSSLKKYEEGVKLARLCQAELDEAKKKVEALMTRKDGKFTKEKFTSNDGDEK